MASWTVTGVAVAGFFTGPASGTNLLPGDSTPVNLTYDAPPAASGFFGLDTLHTHRIGRFVGSRSYELAPKAPPST